MIHSQLGSLQSSAPTAPSWREEKKLEGLEEGKKDDELAPIYVEGRPGIAHSAGFSMVKRGARCIPSSPGAVAPGSFWPSVCCWWASLRGVAAPDFLR